MSPRPQPLRLPAPCPLCKCVLQRDIRNPGEGVRPHFGTVHRGQPVPQVVGA